MSSAEKEAREYATARTQRSPLNLASDPADSAYADKYMANVGEAGIKRQQRGMHETAVTETQNQEARDAFKAQRAARDLGGKRTPPYK
jgi:Spy/CpxP family protein refolding chaperone